MRTLKRRVHTVGVPRTPPYTCAPKKETRCSCASSHPCLRTTLRYRMDYQENRETQYPLERLSSRGSLEILWSTTTRIACLRFCRLQAAIAEQVRGSPVVADPQQRECPGVCLLERRRSGAGEITRNTHHVGVGVCRLTKKQNCPIRYEYRELQYAETNAYVHCTSTRIASWLLVGSPSERPGPGGRERDGLSVNSAESN